MNECCHGKSCGENLETPADKPIGSAGRAFRITGMCCAEEVGALKAEIGTLVGGEESLAFDILNGRMSVLNDTVDNDEIIKAVARTGMKATPLETGASSDVIDDHRRAITRMTWISGAALLSGFLTHAWLAGSALAALGAHESAKGHEIPLAAITLYAAAIITGGWHVFPKAFFALKRFRPDMNLLMTVAVTGAAVIGEWFEAATVAFLFALSLALESWSVGRARRAIAALMQMVPETARIKQAGGKEQVVAADAVAPGSVVVVMAGERIPLDGAVNRGASHVNQAPITGESVPVSKTVGDPVFAGTVNGDGTLEITTSKAASDSVFSHIIHLISEAQSRRAPSEQWVERFARIYTPTIMVLAIAALLVPTVGFGLPWDIWFYRALVLLVIACPCALVISTPVSVVASLAASARAGVLVKGGVHLETPAKLRAIAMDKTGTLTEGKPKVVEIIPLSGHNEEALLLRAGALEARSTHPLGAAIIDFVHAQNLSLKPAGDARTVPGKGVTGHYQGKLFWLGSVRYMREHDQETPDVEAAINSISQTGRTVVVIGNETHVCGLIAVADAIRPQAAKTIQRLRESGIEHIVMLTGDNKETAASIAAQVGITEIEAELLPEDKVSAVEKLVDRYGAVAMVGDGVNDAPAMARASLGIAMGAIGSDAAIESADIALMSDDLSGLPWLIAHSRRTTGIIKQNIAFSLTTKTLVLVAALFGFCSLWIAIAADMGTTLVVITNGLRLLRPKKGHP